MDFYKNTWGSVLLLCSGSAVDRMNERHGWNPLTHSVLTIQPPGLFSTQWESWVHHQGPLWPFSELSRSCLNGILIVSCFCVVVFLLSVLFLPLRVRPLHLHGCLSWHLLHHCHTESDFSLNNHHRGGDIWNPRQRDVDRSLCGKQDSWRWVHLQAISRQSISFQIVRQK